MSKDYLVLRVTCRITLRIPSRCIEIASAIVFQLLNVPLVGWFSVPENPVALLWWAVTSQRVPACQSNFYNILMAAAHLLPCKPHERRFWLPTRGIELQGRQSLWWTPPECPWWAQLWRYAILHIFFGIFVLTYYLCLNIALMYLLFKHMKWVSFCFIPFRSTILDSYLFAAKRGWWIDSVG